MSAGKKRTQLLVVVKGTNSYISSMKELRMLERPTEWTSVTQKLKFVKRQSKTSKNQCVCEGPGLGTVRAEAGGFCSNSKFDRFLARKGDGRGFRRAAYHVKRPCGSHVPLDHAEVAPAIHAGQ